MKVVTLPPRVVTRYVEVASLPTTHAAAQKAADEFATLTKPMISPVIPISDMRRVSDADRRQFSDGFYGKKRDQNLDQNLGQNDDQDRGEYDDPDKGHSGDPL